MVNLIKVNFEYKKNKLIKHFVLLESIASKDKSSLQIYEETCKRLNICSCSMIVRSLFTTKINLANYGLGPKGSAALAVALVVSFILHIIYIFLSEYLA
jgi:hypothetical protein